MCNRESQTSSGDGMRLKHIDQMRAIAILCMVEVHTAAIIPPSGITVGHPAAFVAAAFGGMAAPLFVTVSGWGLHRGAQRRFSNGLRSEAWLNWLLPRIALLVACQFLVNILLNAERGGRFEWQTPGILTLLALAALAAPLIVNLSLRARGVLMLAFIATPFALGDLSGPDWGWWTRVGSSGVEEWFERLLINGTYPALPWLSFMFLGSILSDIEENRRNSLLWMSGGFAVIGISIIQSARLGIPFALTEGDAILTFFPANAAFLITAATFVLLTEALLSRFSVEGGDKLAFIEPVGQITLTIYVTHFAVLGAAAMCLEGEPRLALIPAFAITIAHTLVWIPLAQLHQRHCPNISFEALLRRITS